MGAGAGTARRRTVVRSGPTALAAIMLALVLGCDRSGGPAGEGSGAATGVPAPDYADAEPPVIEMIDEARAAVQRDDRSAATWGDLAMVLDAHGFSVEAAVAYGRAEALDPRDPRWPFLLGKVLMRDDPESAVEAYERAIALDGRSLLFRHACGDALVQAGRADEARQHYEQALALEPDCRRALLGLGELALRDGDPAEARRLLELAADLNFYDREVHAKLARVYQRLGDDQRAQREALYVRAYPELATIDNPIGAEVSARAVSAKALVDRGLALVARGRYEEAERQFAEALRLRPDSIRTRLNLGGVLLQQGRVPEAVVVFRQALSRSPDDPEVHNNLAVAFIEGGRDRDAERHVQATLAADPNYDEAHVNRGRILQRQGRADEAEAAYRQAIDCNPVNAMAHRHLADLLGSTGRLGEALPSWREAAEFGRYGPEITIGLALTASRLGRFDEALDVLRRGLRQTPGDPSLLAATITILATAPDPRVRSGAEAVSLARLLLRRTGPGDLGSLNLLAAAQAEAGDFEQAVATSQHVLQEARSAGVAEMVRLVESRLDLYRRGRPFHQTAGTPDMGRP